MLCSYLTHTEHCCALIALLSPGTSRLSRHPFAVCAGNPEMALGFQVTKQGIQLVEPRMRRLDGVRGRTFSAASALLFELMQLGVYLVPQLRDAEPAGLGVKVHSLRLWPEMLMSAPLVLSASVVKTPCLHPWPALRVPISALGCKGGRTREQQSFLHFVPSCASSVLLPDMHACVCALILSTETISSIAVDSPSRRLRLQGRCVTMWHC